MRSFLAFIFWFLGIGGIVYMLIWPVPILPEAWDPPLDKGYIGDFQTNQTLRHATAISTGRYRAPEAIAVDAQGRIYVSAREKVILRFSSDGKTSEVFANTGGRPLGLIFDGRGDLIVADAIKGLLAIEPNGTVRTLADQTGQIRVNFANDLDIGPDGSIYFTDSTTKFRPSIYGTADAGRNDLIEHGGRGRVLRFNRQTKKLSIVLEELQFANGLTLSHDGKSLLVSETGAYRVIRYWLEGKKAGKQETVLENLPGFPDNLTRGLDGRYWLALASPRVKLLDQLAPWPRIRKMTQRLPQEFQKKEKTYGHIIAFDETGKIVQNLQDPTGTVAPTTSVFETESDLLLGNLRQTNFYRLDKAKAKIN